MRRRDWIHHGVDEIQIEFPSFCVPVATLRTWSLKWPVATLKLEKRLIIIMVCVRLGWSEALSSLSVWLGSAWDGRVTVRVLLIVVSCARRRRHFFWKNGFGANIVSAHLGKQHINLVNPIIDYTSIFITGGLTNARKRTWVSTSVTGILKISFFSIIA